MTTKLYPFEGIVSTRVNPFEEILQKCGEACDEIEALGRSEAIEQCRLFEDYCRDAMSSHDVINFERGRVEEFARLFGAVKDNGAYDLNLRALLKFNRNR